MLKLTQTTVTLGLAHPLTVCQISDLHLLHADDRNDDYEREHAAARVPVFPDAHAAAEEIFAWLYEHKPDLLLLTGDILDFPTEQNLDVIRAVLKKVDCPYLYIPGNHDWTFPRGYQSDAQYASNMPRFDEWTGGTPDFQVLELGGIAFLGVDNSRGDSVSEVQTGKLEAALLSYRERGIPTVVCMHVPICSEALTPEAKRVWRFPVMMGDERADAATRRFCDLTAQNADAVIAGHVHFAHDAPLDDSTCMQYIMALSAVGNLRVFRFI